MSNSLVEFNEGAEQAGSYQEVLLAYRDLLVQSRSRRPILARIHMLLNDRAQSRLLSSVTRRALVSAVTPADGFKGLLCRSLLQDESVLSDPDTADKLARLQPSATIFIYGNLGTDRAMELLREELNRGSADAAIHLARNGHSDGLDRLFSVVLDGDHQDDWIVQQAIAAGLQLNHPLFCAFLLGDLQSFLDRHYDPWLYVLCPRAEVGSCGWRKRFVQHLTTEVKKLWAE